jgi:SHO1 osmosensor
MLCCIVGVLVVVASDSTQTYHVAVRGRMHEDCLDTADLYKVVGFLAAGLVFTSSVVNALVYSADGAKEAAAAGFILLSMVAVCLKTQ